MSSTLIKDLELANTNSCPGISYCVNEDSKTEHEPEAVLTDKSSKTITDIFQISEYSEDMTVNIPSNLQNVMQYMESGSDFPEKYDYEIFKFKGDKRRDKYLLSSDYFCTVPLNKHAPSSSWNRISDSEYCCNYGDKINLSKLDNSFQNCTLSPETRKMIEDSLLYLVKSRFKQKRSANIVCIIDKNCIQPSLHWLSYLLNINIVSSYNIIVSSGPNSTVMHATGNASWTKFDVPNECIVKVQNTVCEKVIKRRWHGEAYHYHYTQQKMKKVYDAAKQEADSMIRLDKIGVNSPKLAYHKCHVVVMSFIGKNKKRAPKLVDMKFNESEWEDIYHEVGDAMDKMYNGAKLVHGDVCARNILWWQNKCWFVDFSEAVDREDHYDLALKRFLKDCRSISFFFKEKGVQNVVSGEDMFARITGVEEWWSHNFI